MRSQWWMTGISALVLVACGTANTPDQNKVSGEAGGVSSSTTLPVPPGPQITPGVGNVAQELAELAKRPELQDEEVQATVQENSASPTLLLLLKESLELPYSGPDLDTLLAQEDPEDSVEPEAGEGSALEDQPLLTAQGLTKKKYAQSIAWGTVSHYFAEKKAPKYTLDWSYNGCSAPSPLKIGLTWKNAFFTSCNVHDFGYRNLPRLTNPLNWKYNRWRTDVALLKNTRAYCIATRTGATRVKCVAASLAYYVGVRKFAWPWWVKSYF